MYKVVLEVRLSVRQEQQTVYKVVLVEAFCVRRVACDILFAFVYSTRGTGLGV